MGKLCLLLSLTFGLGTVAQASSITFIGEDTTTLGKWRTSSVIKPFSNDGDNIYGTDGYALLDASGSNIIDNPAGVSVTRVAQNQFPGNSGYTTVDNPAGGSIRTGVWYDSTAQGTLDQYAQLTFSATESYLVGVYTDNQDFADISPSPLYIAQTAGGSATSGPVVNTVNRNGDWFFFDVSGVAGDTFVVEGNNVYQGSGAQASDGIGLISFDGPEPISSTTPEPASLLLIGSGLLALMRRTVKR